MSNNRNINEDINLARKIKRQLTFQAKKNYSYQHVNMRVEFWGKKIRFFKCQLTNELPVGLSSTAT